MFLYNFLANHVIFTSKELRKYLCTVQTSSAKQAEEQSIRLIMYHVKQGHIFQVRRGLYYTYPKESIRGKEYPADPYLIAAKLTDDAVLAYNTALGIHGLAHSLHNFFYFLSEDLSIRKFHFQENTFVPVIQPKSLRDAHKQEIGITTINREGISLRVTTLERTFVDALSRPNLIGEEELWRTLEGITYLNLDEVIDYTLLLSHKVTAAKIGFFLEQHREQFRVSDADLQRLQSLRPVAANYFLRKRRGPQKLISAWNLIVPEYLLLREWEEPNADF